MRSGSNWRAAGCAAVSQFAVLVYMLTDDSTALVITIVLVMLAGVAAAFEAPALAWLIPVSLAVVWLPLAVFNDSLPATDPGAGAGEGLAVVLMAAVVAASLAAVAIGTVIVVARGSGDGIRR